MTETDRQDPSRTGARRPEFDDYASRYEEMLSDNLGRFGRHIDYYAEYKIRTIRRCLSSPPADILEYGCGIGRNIPFLEKVFPGCRIAGCDVSIHSLDVAKRANPQAEFFPVPAGCDSSVVGAFDVVLMACVLHHVPVEARQGCVEGAASFLRPCGSLFVFEHNPLNPLTRRMVNTCPFDGDAVLLPLAETNGLLKEAGLRIKRAQYVLFFPAALRAARPLEFFMRRVPLGGQYFLQAEKEGDSSWKEQCGPAARA